jgi:hypothetical protein
MTGRNKIVLLHWNGRFGNRMFTYVFLRHYAEKFKLDIWVPSNWEGDVLFEDTGCKIIDDDELRLYLNQTIPELDSLDARLAAINRYNQKNGDNISYMNPDDPGQFGRINVCIDSLACYHDSIFRHYSRDKILNNYCRFSDSITGSELYKRMQARQGTYHIAHLRRDDIVNPEITSNQGYSVISRQSYEKAFVKYGYDPETVEWVTDDKTGNWGIIYPKYEDNWRYPEGSQHYQEIIFSWFPDFLKLMFAKTIFRANSSFSWWASFLSNAKVYSPRLHTRVLFHQTGQETDFEFEEGNHPHWLCIYGQDQCDDIIIK